MVGQAVLGTERFVARLAKALEKSGTGTLLKKRPALEQIVAVVEGLRHEKSEAFRDLYGDSAGIWFCIWEERFAA